MNDADWSAGVPAAVALSPVPEVEHHPLARDPVGDDFWGRIERWTFVIADRLNPILIKESRESLKSREFLIAFFLLLAATLLWTCMGIIFNAPEVYYLPTGTALLAGYYFLLAVPIFGLVPLTAFRSLSSEIDNDTFELMSITELASSQIVRGKFASSVLQMVLYLAAVVPSLAFTYLLRGVSLAEIVMMVVAILLAGLVLTSLALMIAPQMTGYLGQSLAMVGLIAAILFVQFVMAAMCLAGILGTGIAATSEGWLLTLATASNVIVVIVVFLKAAAAGIAPVSENRSTRLRCWMLLQQVVWIITMVAVSFHYDDFEPINFGCFVLAVYWVVMGTMSLTESSEISPRVRRELPATILGRSFLSVFVPGPTSGYLFALCSGSVAIISLGLFGSMVKTRAPVTEPIIYALVMAGYLMSYLGLTRLVTLPLAIRGRLPLAGAVLTLAVLLVLTAITPSAIWVILEGRLPMDYRDLDVLNSFWTSLEGFDGGLPAYLPGFTLAAGIALTVFNFVWMRDLYRYRKIAVPDRVLAVRIPADHVTADLSGDGTSPM